jgi:hypothetical protein
VASPRHVNRAQLEPARPNSVTEQDDEMLARYHVTSSLAAETMKNLQTVSILVHAGGRDAKSRPTFPRESARTTSRRASATVTGPVLIRGSPDVSRCRLMSPDVARRLQMPADACKLVAVL